MANKRRTSASDNLHAMLQEQGYTINTANTSRPGGSSSASSGRNTSASDNLHNRLQEQGYTINPEVNRTNTNSGYSGNRTKTRSFDVRNMRNNVRNTFQQMVDEANSSKKGKELVDYGAVYDNMFGTPSSDEQYAIKDSYLKYAAGDYQRKNTTTQTDHLGNILRAIGGSIGYDAYAGENPVSPARNNTAEYQQILDQIEQNKADRASLPARQKVAEEAEAKRQQYDAWDVKKTQGVIDEKQTRENNLIYLDMTLTELSNAGRFEDFYDAAERKKIRDTAKAVGLDMSGNLDDMDYLQSLIYKVGDMLHDVQNNILYYDENGVPVTYQSLLGQKRYESDTGSIRRDQRADAAYNKLVEASNVVSWYNEAFRSKTADGVGANLHNVVEEVGGVTGQSQLDNFLKEKYGKTSAEMSEEELNRIIASYSASYDDASRVLASLGYDWKNLLEYEKKEQAKQTYLEKQQNWEKFAHEHPIYGTGLAMVTAPSSGIEYAFNAASDMVGNNPYTGGNVYGMDYTTATGALNAGAGERVYDDVYRLTGYDTAAWLAQTAYSGVTSSIQSAVTMAVASAIFGPDAGGAVGMLMLGSQAAASTYQQAVLNGSTNGQAFLYSLASGLNEAIFEKLSFGELESIEGIIKTGMDSGRLGKEFFKAFALQGLTEGSEEVFTDLANSLADKIINGDLSEYNRNVQAYIQQGYSREEAEHLASMDYMQQLLESGLGGMFGGMVSGGGKAVSTVAKTSLYKTATGARNAADSIRYNSAVKQNAGNIVNSEQTNVLIEKGAAAEGDSRAAKQARKAAAKLSDIDTSTKKGRKQAARQAAKAEKALLKYNSTMTQGVAEDKARSIVADEVKKAGFTGSEAEALTSAIYKSTFDSKEYLSERESALLNNTENHKDIVDAVLDRFTKGEVNDAVRNARVKANTEISNILGAGATEIKTDKNGNRITQDGIVINDEGADLKADGTKVEVAGIASIEGNKITYKLSDGTTATQSEVSLGSLSKALVYEGVAKMGVNPSIANVIIDQFNDSNLTGMEFVAAAKEAYLEGYSGNVFGEGSLSHSLSEVARHAIVEAGKADARMDGSDTVSRIKAAQAKYKELFGEDGTIRNSKGVYTISEGGNSVSMTKSINEYTEDQQAQIKVLLKLANRVTHNNIHIFESAVVNGQRVYSEDIVIGGEVVAHKGEAAPNGFYLPTGDVFIDLYAGNDGEGTILWTAAHELTHFLHDWNAKGFRELANTLVNQYGSKTMSELIDIKAAERDLDRRTAYEEVVADAMEQMFTDPDCRIVMDRIMAENETLGKKIADFLTKFADALDSIYATLPAKSDEARLVANMSSEIRQTLANLYGTGLVEAGKNYKEGTIDLEGHIGTDAIRGTSDNLTVHNPYIGTDELAGTRADWRRENSKPEPKMIRSLSAGGKNSMITDPLEGLTPHYIQTRAGGKDTLAYTVREIREYAMRQAGKDMAISHVNKFMDAMGKFMERAGIKYHYIGLQDIDNAQLHFTYDADGNVKSVVMSAMVKNGEYPVNFDFSSICKKRVAMSWIMDEMANRGMLDNKVYDLSQKQLFRINQELKDAGYETACLGCFVESKRYNIQAWAESFCKKWNTAVEKLNKNAGYFDFVKGEFSFDNLSDRQIRHIDNAANEYNIKTGEERRKAKRDDMAKRADEGKQFFPQYITAATSDKIWNSDKLTLKQKHELICEKDENGKWVRLTGKAVSARTEKFTEDIWTMLLGDKIIRPSDLCYKGFSEAQRKRINASEILTDDQKADFLSRKPNDLSLEEVNLLIDSGILAGKAISNETSINKLVESLAQGDNSKQFLKKLKPSDLVTEKGISQLEQIPNFHGILYGHYGSGTPKLIQGFTPYNSEIALLPAKKGNMKLAEYLYTIAGVRMQSFSDFQIQNIYDYIQMIADLSARELPAHAYTKEIGFAELLGMTGIKTNLSVMFDIDVDVDDAHAGLTKYNADIHGAKDADGNLLYPEYAKIVYTDEHGKWVYNVGDLKMQRAYETYNRLTGNSSAAKRFLQSIGFSDAIKLQSMPGYTSNIGIIGVGYSKAHILAMLNDPRIRYIIPYHKSSLPPEIAAATHIEKAVDYTNTQNNMKIKTLVDREGKPVMITDSKGKTVEYSLRERFKVLGSGKAVIEELNDNLQNNGWKIETKKAQNGHGKFQLYEALENENSPYAELENTLGIKAYADPKATTELLMAWCVNNNTLPLFYEFAGHENYYKVIYDFNVYDNVTGEYAPQKAVENIFPVAAGVAGNVDEGEFDSSYFESRIDGYMSWQNGYNESMQGKIGEIVDNIQNDSLKSIGVDGGISFLRNSAKKDARDKARIVGRDGKTYAAMHRLTLNALYKWVDKDFTLVNPSIGITDVDNPYNSFGEAAIVFEKNKFNADDANFPTFNGDAYSQSSPPSAYFPDIWAMNDYLENKYSDVLSSEEIWKIAQELEELPVTPEEGKNLSRTNSMLEDLAVNRSNYGWEMEMYRAVPDALKRIYQLENSTDAEPTERVHIKNEYYDTYETMLTDDFKQWLNKFVNDWYVNEAMLDMKADTRYLSRTKDAFITDVYDFDRISESMRDDPEQLRRSSKALGGSEQISNEQLMSSEARQNLLERKGAAYNGYYETKAQTPVKDGYAFVIAPDSIDADYRMQIESWMGIPVYTYAHEKGNWQQNEANSNAVMQELFSGEEGEKVRYDNRKLEDYEQVKALPGKELAYAFNIKAKLESEKEYSEDDRVVRELETKKGFKIICFQGSPDGGLDFNGIYNFDNLSYNELKHVKKIIAKVEENHCAEDGKFNTLDVIDKSLGLLSQRYLREANSFITFGLWEKRYRAAYLQSGALPRGKRGTAYSAGRDTVKFIKEKKKAEAKKKAANNKAANKNIRKDARQLAPKFYSQLERTISNMKMDKIGGSSVINFLKGKGVKDEEIKWSGLIPFLEGKKSVTKAELQQVLDESRIQIETFVKDDSAKVKYKIAAYEDDWTDAERQEYAKLVADSDRDAKAFEDAWFKEFGEKYPSDSKYSMLTMEASSYMPESGVSEELKNALALASESNSKRASFQRDTSIVHRNAAKKMAEKKATRFGGYAFSKGYHYREYLFSLSGSEYTNSWMRTHWHGFKGVIAHARVQDMASNRGNMLFIEEIQSDWHNEGMKSGFENSNYTLEVLPDRYGNDVYWLVENGKITDTYGDVASSEQIAKANLRDSGKEITKENIKNEILRDMLRNHKKKVPDAPYAGAAGSYVQFVLKNLIYEAAQSYYTCIGWPTGQLQSDRWGDNYSEGFRIEYDQEIPKFLKKYGKQWGATVGKATLENGAEVWAMNITYDMIKSVLNDGQPMFDKRRKNPLDRSFMSALKVAAQVAEQNAENKPQAEWLHKYQEAIDNVNETRQDLEAARAKVRELKEKASAEKKANGDVSKETAEKLIKAQNNVKTYTGRMNARNERMRKLGEAQPVKAVLGDAIKQYNDELEQRLEAKRERQVSRLEDQIAGYKERRVKAVDKHKSVEARQKIHKLLKDFNKRLTNPTENAYIPKSMKGVVADLLNQVEFATPGTNLSKELSAFKVTYDAIANNPEENIYHDKMISDMIAETIKSIGETQFNDLSAAQATQLLNTMKAIDHTIKDAIKVKGIETEQNAFQFAKQMMTETGSIEKPHDNIFSRYINTSLRAQAMFNRLGNHIKDSNWSKLYDMLDAGQLKMTQILMEGERQLADIFADRESLYALSDYKNGLVDVGLKDENGKPVKITRGMMLSVYMALLNEDNARHVMYGGYTIPDMKAYYKSSPDAYGTGETRTASQVTAIQEAEKKLADLKHQKQELIHKRVEIREGIKELKRAKDTVNQAKQEAALKEITEKIEDYDTRIEDATENLEEAVKFVDDYVEDMKLRIEGMMTDYEKHLIQKAKNLLDRWSKNKLNETTLEEYGFEKATVENYFPIHTDKDFLGASFDTISRDMALENAGFMKSRIHGTNPVMLEDITDVLNRQIKSVAQYSGLMPAIRQFNRIYGKNTANYENSVQNAIRMKFGPSGIKYIDNLMSDMVGARQTSSTIFDKARGKMAGAVLSVNPRVAMAQAASYPTAAAEIGWKPLLKALAKGGKSGRPISRADVKLIGTYSPLLDYRMKGYSTEEIGSAKAARRFSSKFADKTKWLMGWINAFDGGTVGRLWYAAEYYVQDNFDLEKGSEEYYEQVADVFNRIVEKTQPNYTTLQRPDVLRNPNAIVKQLTMFMTQRLQNFNILYDSCATLKQYSKDAKHGRNETTLEDVKDARAAVVRAVTSQVVAAFVIVAMKGLSDIMLHSVNAYRDDDKELTAESVTGTLINNILDTITSSFLGGSEAYGTTKSIVMGDKYDAPQITGVQAFSDVLSDITNFAKAVREGETEKVPKIIEELTFELSHLTGIPMQNIKKILVGAKNWYIDFANHELGTFEAGVQRTKSQNANIAYNAYMDGNTKKYDKFSAMVPDDDMRDRIKYAWENGDIDSEEAVKQLTEIGGKEANDAYWTVDEWEGKADDGEYHKYDKVVEAVRNKDYTSTIDEYLANGASADSIKKAITADWRDEYVNASTHKKLEILEYIKKVFKKLGYTTDNYKDGRMKTNDDGWPIWTKIK